MISPELAQTENHLAKDVSSGIRKILESPPSSNYMHRQMQLVYEKTLRENPEIIINAEILNKSMADWSGSELSKAFNLIAKSELFGTHKIFRGDIANITLKDVEYAAENNRIPED